MNIPVLTFSRIEDSWFDGYTTSWIGYPDGVNQTQYLEFAENDLADGVATRNLINAVSNAKRALHLEVETLSNKYGYSVVGKKFNSFWQRLEFLSAAGFFAKPRLLTKLNKLRNAVEHEYIVPTVDEAENFVDVVGLFIDAMQRHRQRYPCEVAMHDGFDDSGNFFIICTCCNFEKGELNLTILPKGKSYSSREQFIKSINIIDDRDEYIRWLSFIIRNNT